MQQAALAGAGKPKFDLLLFLCMTVAALLLSYFGQAQNRAVDQFPIPSFTKQTQFYLQRTTDANTIMYDLNFQNGVLNEKEPIKPYWIRYTEKGAKKNLSSIQNHYAFGIKSTKIRDGQFKLRFAGYEKVPLYLKQLSNGTYQTSVQLDGEEMVLQRLYIHIEPGGTFWSPNIGYIEFKGKETASGKLVQKRIHPKS
ncbi:MAG: hypothetical protein BGO31_04840 [Bacteroidetes bacterium 43-16]|nr:MAG: hypothetical protein BGO31_04840 [Bacteroidetes bacterium 43-16]